MHKLLPLSLVALILACRPVGPTYVPPKPKVPDQYAAAAAAGTAAPWSRWWETLGDAQLNALVRKALTESPDFRIAQARLRQARAWQGIQDAAGGPSLSLNGQVSKDRLSPNGEIFANVPGTGLKTEFTNYQAGFDASWELDFFGHQRRLSEAAQARTEASADRLNDTRVMLAAEVARNYVEFREGQGRIALAGENLGTIMELVRLTTLAAQKGDRSQLDVQQAELELSSYQASVSSLQVGLRQNLTALGVLTGTPFDELERSLGKEARPLSVPPAPAAGIPSDLLRQRPDLKAAERDLAAANADVGVAVAERYPRFSLVGTGGWNSIQSGNLLSNASRTWSLGPQLSLPIFTSGLLKSQVRQAEAGFDAALATYHKAVLSALADVEVAVTRMARNEEKRIRLQGAEDRQRRILALTECQFKAGDVSRMAAIQSRRTLADQEDQSMQARAQSLTALISVHKALGGGWAD